MGDAVFVILHLLQGYGNGFRELIAVISCFEVFSHKCTNGIEKIGGDDNIPVLAGISFFAVKMVDIGLVQENDISGVQSLRLSVEGVGNGAFQNIENFIETMTMDNLVTVFGNFGVKWL